MHQYGKPMSGRRAKPLSDSPKTAASSMSAAYSSRTAEGSGLLICKDGVPRGGGREAKGTDNCPARCGEGRGLILARSDVPKRRALPLASSTRGWAGFSMAACLRRRVDNWSSSELLEQHRGAARRAWHAGPGPTGRATLLRRLFLRTWMRV